MSPWHPSRNRRVLSSTIPISISLRRTPSSCRTPPHPKMHSEGDMRRIRDQRPLHSIWPRNVYHRWTFLRVQRILPSSPTSWNVPHRHGSYRELKRAFGHNPRSRSIVFRIGPVIASLQSAHLYDLEQSISILKIREPFKKSPSNQK